MLRISSGSDWVSWVAPGLTVVAAVLLSLIGAEIARLFAGRQLEGLRTAHWTEQARVFTETNTGVRLFRLYLITVTTPLVLMGLPSLGSQQLLRFCALATLFVIAIGDPGADRWVRRATAGSLTASSWLQNKGFGL